MSMGGQKYVDGCTNEAGLVTYFFEFTAGASGAVPALSAFQRSKGLLSAVRNSTGNYTVTLKDPAISIVAAYGSTVQSSVAAGDGTTAVVISRSTTTRNASFVIQFFRTDTVVAADPKTGASVLFEVVTQGTGKF